VYPNQICPSGKPDIIYHAPELYGCSDHKVNLPSNIETIASDYITKKSDFGCSEDFEELALRLMLQHNLLFPKDETECRQLYDRLLYEIANI